MVVAFRLIYICSALLSIASGVLVAASFFMQDRPAQSFEFLGTHLVVSAAYLGVGVLLMGIQKHVANIAAKTRDHDVLTVLELTTDVRRLVAYLLAAGALLCAMLGAMAYGILDRIDQGFAIFG